MAMVARRACIAALALVLLAASAQGQSTCRIRWVIDPATSNATLGGNNALVPPSGATLNAPISQLSSSPRPVYQGALYTSFPWTTGGCPTALTDLAQGLQSTTWRSNGTDFAYMAEEGPFQGIAMQPAQITGLTAGQTYQPQNIEWNLTTTSVTVSRVNSTYATMAIQGTAVLLQGWLKTDNLLTGNRYDNIATGQLGSFSAAGYLSMAGNASTIRFTSFNLSQTSVGSLVIGGTNYTSVTTLSFNGVMTLNADLSCRNYCGDYGRCVSVNGTVGCQCECGWKADRTGTCTVASGYCPVWGASSDSGTCTISVPSDNTDSTTNAPPVSIDSTTEDEGAANVYRPVISFVPLMLQLLVLLILAATMWSARAWYTSHPVKSGTAAVQAAPHTLGPRAVAEGLAEAEDSEQANDQQHGLGMLLTAGEGQVVVQLPPDDTWQQQQQTLAGAPVLTFDSVSVWVAPGMTSALINRMRRPGSSDTPQNHKRILTSVSGRACGGRLLGLMGPSGSGKSTLLNVLSGQVQAGGRWRITGQLAIDGEPVSARQLSRTCAHVPQHDLLLPGLTVEECLRYAAAVRLGSTASPAYSAARVETLLEELHITHIRSAYGGSGGSGGSTSMAISGGERQRVSLGMELIAEVRLLLLDEPTSGLDSFNALSLVRMLSRVARGTSASGPRIVVASLHQPSPALFSLLDEVLLLAKGRLVYAGTPAAAPAAFAQLGLPCPDTVSVAEHMLMVVGDPQQVGGLLERLEQRQGHVGVAELGNGNAAAHASGGGADDKAQGATTWSGTPSSAAPAVSVLSVPSGTASGEAASPRRAGAWGMAPVHGGSSSFALSLTRKPGVLFWRSVARLRRDPMLFLFHVAGAIAMGIIVGFVFFNTTKETTAGVIGRLGTIFFTVNVLAFPSISAMDMMLDERQVVERELARGYYSPATYMINKLVVDGLLLRTIPSMLYCTPFYWIMGLRHSASAFTIFLGVLAGFTSLIGAFVMLLTNLLGAPGRIIVTTTTLLLIFALFSGFLANKEEMHWALRWICYVSPLRWAWEALVINEIRFMALTLSVADLPPIVGYPGDRFLFTLGVDPGALTLDVIVILVEYVGLCILAVLSLYLRIFLKTHGWIL